MTTTEALQNGGQVRVEPPPKIGSNTPGVHPSSQDRPVHYEEWSKPSARGYSISDHLINEPPPNRPFRVVVIGAGAAGIDFLHHATIGLQGLDIEVVCYEKNKDIGGTWFENRYPGCACDIPSASYQFAWRPDPGWKSYYSGAKQIWQYMKTIVEEEGMMKYINLEVAVTSAVWRDDISKWTVQLRRTRGAEVTEWTEETDLLVSGTGFLKFVSTNGLWSELFC